MTLTPDNLEQHLADLTAAPEAESTLWQRVLDNPHPMRRPSLRRILVRPIPHPALAACLVILVGALLVGILLPSLGRPRQAARQLRDSTQIRGIGQALLNQSSPASADTPLMASTRMEQQTRSFASAPLATRGDASPDQSAEAIPSRSVIRKATIELISDDVRAAFAKAAHLISDASGEYVQDSSLTGEGKATQGQLTLRVTVARLSSVLDQLRNLGTVRSENSGGEDVTSQVVDLDARIRNEQRVEAELLQLLDKRSDAPLKDVLEVRNSLNDVRQTIERLIGERQRIGRLIDLATILVIIRAPEEAPKPAAATPPPSLGEYFRKNIAASWRSGLEFLADTLASLLALALGGLVWWCLAALLVYAVLRHRRAGLARGV